MHVNDGDETGKQRIIDAYLSFLENKEFPCIAAKAALAKQQVKCIIVDHMACPHDDTSILEFLYKFIDAYRESPDLYHTAAVIFRGPQMYNEEMFDGLLWQRLQALHELDAKKYGYDSRVDADPLSASFSFSIKEEAFYIIGLHTASSRQARQFAYPVLVFNPHVQFEQLRVTTKYDKMKDVVRKRDIVFSGSVNPMLNDFGKHSEVYQYSGRNYDESWECPLKISHAQNKNNPSP
ncbi:MAG: YqcI/YcgG family protein [Chitinophagaceae bacterium]|nr:YqcI/YcgG family protein [Chitinophagaceae bacterium]